MYHYSCNHFLENRERSVCTVTALAVDETGIAAALGSSGRVRKNTWGLLWSREMGGVVRPQRDQEFSIPGFPGRDFAKSRDPGIFWDGISLKFQSRDFREL